MKWTALGIVLFVIVLILAFHNVGNQFTRTFQGEIMDSQCAQMGSHQAMMTAQGLQAALQCTLYCVHSAQPTGSFVLYDAANRSVYQLDNQLAVEPYAAEMVKITGTYNSSSKTIAVATVTALP